jgi:hypothetical protein
MNIYTTSRDHHVITTLYELKMEDEEDDLLLLSVVVLRVIARRRKRRRQRSCWIRRWIGQRSTFGAHSALIQEIRETDPRAYQNFFRMDPGDYNELLEIVTPAIYPKVLTK